MLLGSTRIILKRYPVSDPDEGAGHREARLRRVARGDLTDGPAPSLKSHL